LLLCIFHSLQLHLHLLLLYDQEGILEDFLLCVASGICVCVAKRIDADGSAFLEVFGIIGYKELVDSALAEQVALALFCDACAITTGTRVHPVDTSLNSPAAGGFLEFLKFFECTLLFAFLTQLLDLLALLERRLLFLPYALLILAQMGMP
jgi:hypothetical protein